MSNNVNVVNNAGKDVVVTVNNSNGNTQIVIDLAGNKVELSSLESGQVFKGNSDTEYILLEFTQNGDVRVLRKDLLPNDREFGSDNNFDGSEVDKYLNSTYIKELVSDFGIENIVEHDIDLTSFDGLADYGKIKRKVSLLPFDIYRRCRKYIGENMPRWWWLIDANSTPSGCGSDGVQCVRSGGGVGCGWFSDASGVRPFCILKSSIFVSLEEPTE